MKRMLLVMFLIGESASLFSQRFNAGINFQYLVAKQVKIDAPYLIPSESYNFYNIIDNRWKLFSAGQSIVIGTAFQYSFKKFYVAIEPGYELNTYNYTVSSPVSPGIDEKVTFQTLFFQTQIPLLVGFQFKSSNIIRYSVFAGAGPVKPYEFQTSIQEKETIEEDLAQYNRYWYDDMRGILYTDEVYVNGIAGIGINFASLVRVDVRFVHRFGSPSERYDVSFNTLGVGLTYYLPLNVLSKKIYYEE